MDLQRHRQCYTKKIYITVHIFFPHRTQSIFSQRIFLSAKWKKFNSTMEGDYDPKYTEMCSAQTIQSNDKGFFNEMYGSVRKMCPEKWMESVFRQQIGDRAKIQSLFGDCDGNDILMGMLEHVAPVYKQKNAQFSSQRRREGEKLFDQGDTAKALILLSQAVLRAPDKGYYSIRIQLQICLKLNFFVIRSWSADGWWNIIGICTMGPFSRSTRNG